MDDTDEMGPVEVRNRFDGTWSPGFEVTEIVLTAGEEPRFRLRRMSDGYVLPALFLTDELASIR